MHFLSCILSSSPDCRFLYSYSLPSCPVPPLLVVSSMFLSCQHSTSLNIVFFFSLFIFPLCTFSLVFFPSHFLTVISFIFSSFLRISTSFFFTISFFAFSLLFFPSLFLPVVSSTVSSRQRSHPPQASPRVPPTRAPPPRKKLRARTHAAVMLQTSPNCSRMHGPARDLSQQISPRREWSVGAICSPIHAGLCIMRAPAFDSCLFTVTSCVAPCLALCCVVLSLPSSFGALQTCVVMCCAVLCRVVLC